VNVTLPKFEIDTSFNTEMNDYLQHAGISTAFTELADFSTMMDSPVMIDSVIQKTKIKVDEKGLEAAAATAVMVMGTSAVTQKPIPVYFTADKPFTFYVFTDDASLYSPELLFYGQYVK
jgi:serpin B